MNEYFLMEERQLKSEIQNLEGPSMLIKQPPDPRSLSHHTVSSKRKIVPEPPKVLLLNKTENDEN